MTARKNGDFNNYQYLGAIHIHSKYSDGTGDIDFISKAAKKAGLDWIIISDHNNFDTEEGFFNGVCVIKGEEISPQSENHYLALGTNKNILPNYDINKTIQEVKKYGGFGFAVHPDEGVNDNGEKRKNPYSPIQWSDKNNIPDGIEIWNWFSQWADNLNEQNIFGLIYSFIFKHKLVSRPRKETLNWWDELNSNSEKIIPAIGGLDAHALRINKYIIPVTIFPYKEMFETITNIIYLDFPLTNDFMANKSAILNALKNGNNIIINRAVSKNIPEINIKNTTTKASFGECIKLDNQTSLSVETAELCRIKVLVDGKEIKNIFAKQFQMLIDKVGKYRVEIEIKKKGFAYSNPILVH